MPRLPESLARRGQAIDVPASALLLRTSAACSSAAGSRASPLAAVLGALWAGAATITTTAVGPAWAAVGATSWRVATTRGPRVSVGATPSTAHLEQGSERHLLVAPFAFAARATTPAISTAAAALSFSRLAGRGPCPTSLGAPSPAGRAGAAARLPGATAASRPCTGRTAPRRWPRLQLRRTTGSVTTSWAVTCSITRTWAITSPVGGTVAAPADTTVCAAVSAAVPVAAPVAAVIAILAIASAITTRWRLTGTTLLPLLTAAAGAAARAAGMRRRAAAAAAAAAAGVVVTPQLAGGREADGGVSTTVATVAAVATARAAPGARLQPGDTHGPRLSRRCCC